jgi:signal transduction histidine kinase
VVRRQWEAALVKYVARLEILQRLDRSILAARSLAEISKAAVEGIADLVPIAGTDVMLFDPDANRFTMIAMHTADRERSADVELPRHVQVPACLFEGIQDLQQGKVLVVHDVEHASVSAAALETLRARGIGAYVCVPLIAQEELLGVISLGSDRPDTFTPEQIDIVREVAHALAVAVQQSRLLEQLWYANQRLKSLSSGLVEMQEEERRRLARELHDEIGQTLTAVKLNLQTVQRRVDGVATGPEIEDSIAVVQAALQQVRSLALDLRPSLLDDLGLVATLRWYLDRQAQLGEFDVGLVARPADLRLPPRLELVCFRIVQEALTNVLRHADATHVQVVLEQQGSQVDLVIQDDGTGFDVAAALARAAQGTSLGLVGMQERAALAGGQVQIDSALGHGTEVHARFSVSNPEYSLGPESAPTQEQGE